MGNVLRNGRGLGYKSDLAKRTLCTSGAAHKLVRKVLYMQTKQRIVTDTESQNKSGLKMGI